MPRRNRVDPWGDLHAVAPRGKFTGNRGCVVDDDERVVRHHGSQLWITCRTSFRGWRHPLAAPRRWTPLFFLDDAVALAAGHRPCATCRREDYSAYRDAVTAATGSDRPILAKQLDQLLQAERHRRGRGRDRHDDRITWTADAAGAAQLPDGTVVVDGADALLLVGDAAHRFSFAGWGPPIARTEGAREVLTPPTSVAALAHGFEPTISRWRRP